MKNGFLFRVMALALCMTFLSSTGLFTVSAGAEKAPDKVGLVQVIPGGINATSFIRGKDLNAYVPARMMDGRDDTCWQFSTKDSELKETFVYISFDKGAQVDQLWIKNGFWKNTDGLDQYERNARIKEMKVSFWVEGSDGFRDPVVVTLPETKDWKKREIGCLVDVNGHNRILAIRIEPVSVYRGSKFNDLCVSDIRVYGEVSYGE